jgi:hypothetical protein
MDSSDHPCSFFLDRAAAVEASAAVVAPAQTYTLPFPPDRAVHHRELAAAAAVVESACRLCVDVSAHQPPLLLVQTATITSEKKTGVY